MEVGGFGLQPVGRTGAAAQPGHRVHVQQDGEVRGAPAGRPPVEPGDLLDRQVPAGPLVGEGGVDVPVGDDDRAPVQGGRDDRGDVLGPVGRVHQRLGVRRHAGVRGVQQQRAQPHPDLGRAGLVRGHHVVAEFAQPDGDQPGLRGLARALAALERDQPPGRAAAGRSRSGARARGPAGPARCGSPPAGPRAAARPCGRPSAGRPAPRAGTPPRRPAGSPRSARPRRR